MCRSDPLAVASGQGFDRRLNRRYGRRIIAQCRSESGAEAVEFALVLSILMVLLLGMVVFGRAFDVYQTITRAAREGAREAVLTECATCADPTSSGYTATNIEIDFVDPVLKAASLDPSKVQNYAETIGWLDPSDTPPQECGITISFTYPYTLELPFTTLDFMTVNIPAHVQMRMEDQATGGSCP